MDDYRLHTPEQVAISYTTAGLGYRFAALLIDTTIQIIILFLLITSVATSSIMFGGYGSEPHIALFIVVFALIFQGYFLILELLLKGKTPGKALMKIRVVRIDGRPADVSGIILRNIVRLVDFLPTMYAIGVISMFINKDSRRLGDLVAGTIVIVERKQDSLNAILAEQDTVVNTALSNQEYAVIRDFFARQKNLSAEARSRLAAAIATPLYDKCNATDEERAYPEKFLYRLLHRTY